MFISRERRKHDGYAHCKKRGNERHRNSGAEITHRPLGACHGFTRDASLASGSAQCFEHFLNTQVLFTDFAACLASCLLQLIEFVPVVEGDDANAFFLQDVQGCVTLDA